MFGTLVDKIGNLLSRSFLLANFFPFLIFTVFNLLLADAVVPGAHALFARTLTWDASSQALLMAFIFIAIAVIAYIVAPLIGVVHQAFEGELFPERLRNTLRREQGAIASDLKTARDQAIQRDHDVSVFAKKLLDRLVEASRANSTLDAMDPRAEAQIGAAEGALAVVVARAAPGEAADPNALAALPRAVVSTAWALRRNATQLPNNAAPADKARAERLAECQRQAFAQVRAAENDARDALIAAHQTLRGSFPLKGIRPTRLANIRAAVEAYSNDAYRVEHEFLWPRLKLVVQGNDKIAAAIETARAQVDFMLLMALLCFLFTLGWVLMFILLGRPFAVIALGFFGQLLVWFFWRMVEESVRQLGALVSAVVDLYRFKLLQEMHIGLPRDLTAERALWYRLQRSTVGAGAVDIGYQHGPSS